MKEWRATCQPGVQRSHCVLFDFQTSHFSAVGVVVHHSPQCMSHELVSIANSHEWHFLLHSMSNPGGCCFAPRQLICHHGPRACDDRCTMLSRLGQWLPFIHLDDVDALGEPAEFGKNRTLTVQASRPRLTVAC